MRTLIDCVFFVIVAVTSVNSRATPEEMRRALNTSPLFSHKRSPAALVPQNVNIVLPASDPDARPMASSNSIVAGRPSFRQQSSEISRQSVTSGSNERQSALPMSQAASVNDRFMNTRPIPTHEATDAKANQCSFEIPSFLMPDPDPSRVSRSNQHCPSFLLPGPSISPSLVTLLVEHWTGIGQEGTGQQLHQVTNQITQMEFEQKCLVPALRAHVVGGAACRSRELTVYLEWLLYLRQKLFNI